jgi:hypothetical protein
MDYIYAILGKYCCKISNWVWAKRWENREEGTGYKKK